MLFIYRLLVVGLLSVGIAAATTAQAGTQLFEGSWIIKAFGNEITTGTGESAFYQATRVPLGNQCNNFMPRCSFSSTPVTSMDKWDPLGGTLTGINPFCTPFTVFSATMRPAKGATATHMNGIRIPPIYRNPTFFTGNGAPNTTFCSGATSIVQKGSPVVGTFTAVTTVNQLGAFSFGSAPATGSMGIRVTGQIGEFAASYPYIYSYTYATFYNARGVFGPNAGPGSFTVAYKTGGVTVAKITVKAGDNKFGGTMQMLGALTTKACYYSNNGCWLGGSDWKYNVAGATAMTDAGVVTAGYVTIQTVMSYHTGIMQSSTFTGVGSRFPWTTGTVTVTAIGRGPHKTVHYEHGYDNRNTATPYGKGTIQMVTPLITKWLGGETEYETAGIGILRIKFIPEPQTWAMLLAGASLIAVGHRMRGR